MQSRWHIPQRPSDVGANLNAEPVTHPQKGWRWCLSECRISYISSTTTTKAHVDASLNAESVTHSQRVWRWCPSECRIISWWCEQRFGAGFLSRLLTLMPIWILNQRHIRRNGDVGAHLNAKLVTLPQRAGRHWCPSEFRNSDTSPKGRAMLMPIWMQNHCPGGVRAVFSVQASSVACWGWCLSECRTIVLVMSERCFRYRLPLSPASLDFGCYQLGLCRGQQMLTSLTSSLTEILV